MSTTVLVIVVLAAVAVAVGIFLYLRRRRSELLRKDFGPEYNRILDQLGDQRKAEAEMAARKERVHNLGIRGLTADERSQFADVWRRTQSLFVDEPSRAVGEPDGLPK